jgi:hypothetical protein
MTSPMLMPTRKARLSSSASPIVRSRTRSCNCVAARTASPRSEILPGTHRQCFLRPGHRAPLSTALQRPSGASSNARALPPRRCALDANSRRHRRPISPTICVRPDLAPLAPWRTQTFRAARCTTNLTGTLTQAPQYQRTEGRDPLPMWLERRKGKKASRWLPLGL